MLTDTDLAELRQLCAKRPDQHFAALVLALIADYEAERARAANEWERAWHAEQAAMRGMEAQAELRLVQAERDALARECERLRPLAVQLADALTAGARDAAAWEELKARLVAAEAEVKRLRAALEARDA